MWAEVTSSSRRAPRARPKATTTRMAIAAAGPWPRPAWRGPGRRAGGRSRAALNHGPSRCPGRRALGQDADDDQGDVVLPGPVPAGELAQEQVRRGFGALPGGLAQDPPEVTVQPDPPAHQSV